MLPSALPLAPITFIIATGTISASPGSNKISSGITKPAKDWEKEALPIGNGRLDSMIFGGVDREHIQFNEDSLWIGDKIDTGAYQAFGDLTIQLATCRQDSQQLQAPVRHRQVATHDHLRTSRQPVTARVFCQ